MDSSGNASSANYKSSIVAGEISSSAVTASASYQLRSGYLITGASSALPVVDTLAVTGVSTTTATVNGNLSDLGTPNPTPMVYAGAHRRLPPLRMQRWIRGRPPSPAYLRRE